MDVNAVHVRANGGSTFPGKASGKLVKTEE